MAEPKFKIDITGDAAGLVAASRAGSSALQQVANDAERYQKRLEEMARAQEEAGRVNAVDSEMESRRAKAGELEANAARLRRELAERKLYAAEVDKEIAAGVRVVGEEEVKAAEESAAAADKSFVSKQQLKGAVKGLREEFPGLAHMAKLALNPIAFITASIGASFALWQYKIKAVTQALAGVEMPDISEAKVGHVNAAAQAFQSFREALEGTVRAYNSVDAAADRVSKKMAAQAEQQKKLLGGQKSLDLARLESKRGSMSEAEYERQRGAIEEQYAAAGIAADKKARQEQLAEKARRAANLRIDAEGKVKAAGQIHVASAEDDAETERRLKERADIAQKSIDERSKRIGDQADVAGGEGNWFWRQWMQLKNGAVYGWGQRPGDVAAMEREGMGADEAAVGQYRSFMERKAARDEARKEKARLLSEAGKAAGEAYESEKDFPEEAAAVNRENATAGAVGRMESLGRAYQQAGTMRRGIEQTSNSIAETLERGQAVNEAMYRLMQQYQAGLKEAEARIAQLESQGAAGRRR